MMDTNKNISNTSKYDRILAKAMEEARKEIEGEEYQPEIKQEINQQETNQETNSTSNSTSNSNPSPSNKIPCQFCGKEIGYQGLNQHEKYCSKNPINIAKWEMDAEKEKEQKKLIEKELTGIGMQLEQQFKKEVDQITAETADISGTTTESMVIAVEGDISIIDPRPAIPLSCCSRDIGYVKENKPFYMKVMGRKVGDKVYVEEVELMRL